MEDSEILFVDDDRQILSLVKEFLSFQGYRITTADNGLSALELIKEKDFDILFSDLTMPNFDGLQLLSAVKESSPDIDVVIITGYGTIESAIEALKRGSYDYIQKPIKLERFKILIDRIIEKRKLQRENLLIKKRLKERYQYDALVGSSRKMQEIYEVLDRISMSSPTVLIQGESGTGKELVANIIHQHSDRKNKPFVAVNCGAVVEGLLESELFGHRKGAFTGAISDKMGLFKAAEGGTLFLDELTEMNPNLQVKLLRALQERKIRQVGDTRETKIDVRIIAATNRDLNEAVRAQVLRKDLFYRLNVVTLKMPPLREIKEDIPLLVNHFLKKFSSRRQKKIVGVSPQTMDILMSYHWPGNVRQLENMIERVYALGVDRVIQTSDLPPEIRRFGEDSNVGAESLALRDHEINLIKKALRQTGGNKPQAAKLLGINTTTIYRKIEKYQINDEFPFPSFS